ncbi:hypothetical protein TWF696_000330 [Orbilia brochopaga]|uniref:Gag protein n=1 Tax=Orbilia brochopaga TaxID=3140254 RepID=A0AAV9VCI7_9PEZI
MSPPNSEVPIILKPKAQNKENITTYWLEKRAFNHPYYLAKTDDWKTTKLKPLLKIIKACAADALRENEKLLNPITSRFPEQPENVIQQIYDAFLQKLEAQKQRTLLQVEGNPRDIQTVEEVYSLIHDMLQSTLNLEIEARYAGQKRWLFCWAVNERGKFDRRKAKAQKSAESANEEKKRQRISIQELVNEEQHGEQLEDEPEDSREA